MQSELWPIVTLRTCGSQPKWLSWGGAIVTAGLTVDASDYELLHHGEVCQIQEPTRETPVAVEG